MNLSFVFPCLNEESTLEACIGRVRASLDADPELEYEIIVADNGSTDRSVEIANSLGVRVEHVSDRGYGAALHGGISAARGEYVMFADADLTYIYEHALPLYREARKHDADMSIASRMTGEIQEGAMPPLHRHLGTPVLTGLINLLFRGQLSDCNSGFRCVRRSAYENWQIRSRGMEFASELLIKALKAGAHVVEIDSGLRRDVEGRVPHLRTWRDGMRHLLFILSERPQLFEWCGLALLLVTSALQLIGAISGPTTIGGLTVFDLHSQALLLLGAITGTQVYLFSCFLYLHGDEHSTALTRRIIGMDEGLLFFLLLLLFGGELLVVGLIVLQWALVDFTEINLVNTLLILIHFLSVPALTAVGLLGLHVFKKTEARG